MTATHLRQKGTGRIFVYTDALSKRKDMVEISPEIVATRIDSLKRQNEELKARLSQKALTKDELAEKSSALAELEAEHLELEKKLIEADTGMPVEEKVLTAEEEDAQALQSAIEKDPEIIKIKTMKEDELVNYLAAEYGIKISKREKIDALRARALEERTARIKESA